MNYKYKDRWHYKILRMKKKITLKEIADYIMVSSSLLSKYENNERNMKQYTVQDYRDYIENN